MATKNGNGTKVSGSDWGLVGPSALSTDPGVRFREAADAGELAAARRQMAEEGRRALAAGNSAQARAVKAMMAKYRVKFDPASGWAKVLFSGSMTRAECAIFVAKICGIPAHEAAAESRFLQGLAG